MIRDDGGDARLGVDGRRRLIAASFVLLGLALALGALGLGALHLPVLVAVGIASASACALAWWGARPAAPRSCATWVTLVGLGLVVWTALSLIPLPVAWLEAISPSARAIWSTSLGPLGPGPDHAPLTLDPVATRVEVLRGAVYVAAFLAALRLSRRKDGVFVLTSIVSVVAVVVAVAALVHPAVGAERVFGFYRPKSNIDARHIAPILNPNSLAAYVNIGACLALGLAVSPRPRIPRAIPFAVFLVLASTQLWIASRGGVVALFAGVAIVLIMSRLGRSHAIRQRAAALVFGATVAAGVAMIVLGSAADAWQELAGTDTTKLSIYPAAWKMIRAFAWTGAGRGAFESVFPAFRTGTGYLVFTHPENVVLQWASEWGLVPAALAIGALVWALRPSIALARGQALVGPWAALTAFALHNLVDFSTEVPGVMVAVSALAGLVCGGTTSGGRRPKLAVWAERPTLVAAGSALLVSIGIVLAIPQAGLDLAADRARVKESLMAEQSAPGERDAVLREALTRHPAEPYFPYMAAFADQRAGDFRFIAWAGRALERSPVHGPTHLVLARGLSRRSPAQARLEYRLAITEMPEQRGPFLAEAVRLVSGYRSARDLVPEDRGSAIFVLDALVRHVAPALPATAYRLDGDLLERDPRHREALARRATLIVEDVLMGPAAPWCHGKRTHCVERALSAVQAAEDAAPSVCEPHALRARVRAASGDVDAALRGLEQAIERVDNRAECLGVYVSIAESHHDVRALARGVDWLVRLGCATDDECVTNLHLAASIEERRGNARRALAFYQRAYTRYPDDERSLAKAAEVSMQIGLYAQAFEAYKKLSELHPENADYAKRRDGALERARAPRIEAPPGASE